MNDEDDFVRITLRIPKALHAELSAATEKKRSMNAEIIGRLEASFATPITDRYAPELIPALLEQMKRNNETLNRLMENRKEFFRQLREEEGIEIEGTKFS